jgi:putative hemolysin
MPETIVPDRNTAMPEESGTSVLGRLGDMVVKIADTGEEIEAALKLRHAVFSGDGSAGDNSGLRDEDRYDAYCDHLIVSDVSQAGRAPQLVATYRLLGHEAAERAGGFYSGNEFEIQPLLARHQDKRFLEFGRSCVLPDYRSKRTIELLWHGSWAYVCRHGYDVMFGCASFAGTDPMEHAAALSFLAVNAGPDDGWQTHGKGERIIMSELRDGHSDLKTTLKKLPPLIKGYLRLGAMFAGEAVVDRNFGTIDVLVLLPIDRLNPRYVKYYGEDAARHAR